MNSIRRFGREITLGVLVIANIFVWLAVYIHRPGDTLKVYFLDVGQGDAILAETPNHKYLLFDGGPTRNVLAEIGKVVPFDTKRIDVVVESHPDKDHIGGLPEVVDRYDVGIFLEPGVESSNSIDDELHKRIEDKNIRNLLARRGMRINFGDEAELLILFPNQDVSNWETNDASVVAKLSYGNKSFLLTGDSAKKTEFILYGLNPSVLQSSVLKVGHHGSRNSTSFLYAEAIAPEYAVISAGAGNSYGHPHQEVLEIFKKLGVQVVATEKAGGLTGLGTIKFETDGNELYLK